MSKKRRPNGQRDVLDFVGQHPPFDLRGALETCIARSALIPGLVDPSESEVERLESTAAVFIERLEAKAISIWDVYFRMVKDDLGLTHQAKERQRDGHLKEIDSARVLQGVSLSSLASTGITRFIPVGYRPDLQGDERAVVSELLFLLNLLVDSILPSSSNKLQWWHLSRAVGAACNQEITDRLAQHPTSREVFELRTQNAAGAFSSLLGRVRAATFGIPPYDDNEKESIAGEHLWDKILRKIHKADQALSDDARNSVVLQLAMDGQFDVIPHEVKMRFIDDARKASARKRGGDTTHVPVFEPLTLEGEPMSDRDPGEESSGEAGGLSRSQKLSRIGRETREISHTLSFDLRRKNLEADTELMASIGPAEKMLRFALEHPDERHTEKQLAEYLGVKSDRTIRNYRIRLEVVRKWLQ